MAWQLVPEFEHAVTIACFCRYVRLSRTADNLCHCCYMLTKLGDVLIVEHMLFYHHCHRDDDHQWNRSPDHDRRGWCHLVRVFH